MGFRAQMGMLHVTQLLSDLVALQKRCGNELWLVSFDVEKCFPSLPWWAVFGVLHAEARHSGSSTIASTTAFAMAK